MGELELVKRGNEESRGHPQYKSKVVHMTYAIDIIEGQGNVSSSRIIDSRP